MKHTPGTWRYEKGDFNRVGAEAWGSIVTETAKGFYYVATIETEPGFDINGNEVDPEANAAFIIKACNAHEELLEACQILLKALSGNGSINKWSRLICGPTYVKVLKAAIAKAEGQK